MNPEPEDLAYLYVLDQLDADQRATFEAQLASNSALASLAQKVEAAVDIRRSLRGLRPTPNEPTS